MLCQQGRCRYPKRGGEQLPSNSYGQTNNAPAAPLRQGFELVHVRLFCPVALGQFNRLAIEADHGRRCSKPATSMPVKYALNASD